MKLEDRDVLHPVVAHHAGRVRLAVAHVGHADRGCPIDDMVVGQDLARRGEDDPGSGLLYLLVAQGRVDVHQSRIYLRGDGRDVARTR